MLNSLSRNDSFRYHLTPFKGTYRKKGLSPISRDMHKKDSFLDCTSKVTNFYKTKTKC